MARSANWSTFFKQSSAAMFVIGGRTGRLRYANPAWEALTGKKLAHYRGTRLAIHRQSSSDFWRVLAPPPEALQGRSCTVRRAVPPATNGPPWWIIDFWPIPGHERLLGIVGRMTLEGGPPPAGKGSVPEWLTQLHFQQASCWTLDHFQSATVLGQRLLQQARLASTHSNPVWLEGEPGTRKRSLAQAIHHAGSAPHHPLVVIDVQALKPYLLDSLLFSPGGLVHSSQMTGIYLRRAELLTRELQARLLNWHQRPHCPRFFFGSIVTAEELVQSGAWLPAAFTRFTPVRLKLPPLRELLEDFTRFISVLQPNKQFSDHALQLCKRYSWPGNYRELSLLLQGINKPTVEIGDLPRSIRELALQSAARFKRPKIALEEILNRIESQLVQHLMKSRQAKLGDIADQLGITRARLTKILSRLSQPPNFNTP